MFLFIAATGFLAGFIDSVVGGGGLISIPALLLTGLPPDLVLGTNKFAGTMGTLTSAASFTFSGKVDLSLIKYLIPFSALGAVLGARTVIYIPPHILKTLITLLLLGVAIYTLLKKDWGNVSSYYLKAKKKIIWSGIMVAVGLGFYDGFFGPGTGSFLIFIFLLFGFDFVAAAGNAKVLNFASNTAALITFMLMDAVNYHYGVTMGVAMVAGALIGSRLAIRKGTSYVRLMFILITFTLIGRQLLDLIHLVQARGGCQ
ncbi:sulfite exporter TauE/SafE family protein [Thermanaeromonas sp.]|uniref:sulfite exporter TauE/SafE family protein n=1 Tax=Thermanaeromonas sp. TaxID=2003697 RepID=UPI003430CD37